MVPPEKWIVSSLSLAVLCHANKVLRYDCTRNIPYKLFKSLTPFSITGAGEFLSCTVLSDELGDATKSRCT